MKSVDVVVVGAGIAGLTSACYLRKSGIETLLIEKEPYVGGMVGSFDYKGFSFERGARGMESSGIIFPMLKELGIEMERIHKPIKIQMENELVTIETEDDIKDYESMLQKLFPDDIKGITSIMNDIRKIMGYMDVLYGIDNPLFIPKPYDKEYLMKTLLPWSMKFLRDIRKSMKLMDPVEHHLAKYTNNSSLIDMIKQHFFTATPTFFALSYFTLYLDYQYPKGGMQTLPNLMHDYFKTHGGETMLDASVSSINFKENTILVKDEEIKFKHIVWTGDLKLFYDSVIPSTIPARKHEKVQSIRSKLAQSKGAESIISLYLTVDLPSSYFEAKGAHSFITMRKEGITQIKPLSKDENGNYTTDIDEIKTWYYEYLKYNTFEISVPNLRDPNLSPEHQTGIMISTLFEYDLTVHLKEIGLYDWLKETTKETFIELFNESIYPGFKDKIMDGFVATPMTIKSYTNAHEGSVSGWSFESKPFPVTYQFLKVSKSVETPFQQASVAGQWVFNPAGIPVAALTGRLAVDRVIKQLKKVG